MKKWIIASVLTVLLAMVVFMVHTQTKPTITKTVQVTLNIQAKPDFTLQATPLEINTFIGRTVAYSASVTSINQFAGEIVFSLVGIPAGVTATIFPSNTLTLGPGETKGVQIEIVIADDEVLIGSYNLSITANSDTYN